NRPPRGSSLFSDFFHRLRRSMRRSVIVFLVVAAACGSDSSTNPPGGGNKSVDVFTLSTAFSPNFVQISAGDTVLFHIVPSNNGEGHDVTFDAKAGAP